MSDSIEALRIEGPQTIGNVEVELRDLRASLSSHLLLPVTLKNWLIGGQASVIQLLLTWGRCVRDPVLLVHAHKELEAVNQLDTLVKRPFGFVGAAMASEVASRMGTTLFTSVANQFIDREIDNIWQGPIGRGRHASQQTLFDPEDVPGVYGSGPRVFLASVDHKAKWKIPQCYFKNGEPRERDDFSALARIAIERSTKMWGDTPVSADTYGDIGAILHELFKNTHQWGRTDEQGAIIRRSVRGMLFEKHNLTLDDAQRCTSDGDPLRDFVSHPELADDGRLRLLEISVFDSGIGLAKQWHRHYASEQPFDSLTLGKEFDFCMNCLEQHKSTSRSPHKGYGLHEVMTTLSKLKAFLRLRTGRLSLFYDFMTSPWSEENGAATMHDWLTRSATLTELPRVEGALYTMLVPIFRTYFQL